MKKYRIHILVVMLIAAAAFCTLVQAGDKAQTGSNDITLNFPDSPEVQEITSLKFSVEVGNVSDSAKVSVRFKDTLPENAIKKTTYQDNCLNIYIAGAEKLIPDGNSLEIGTVQVEKDVEGAGNVKISLIPDSVELINSLQDEIQFPEGEVNLSGGIVEEPETPDAVNKEALDSLIKECSGLIQDEYTEESWKNFEEIRKEAENLFANENADQQSVNEMTEKLRTAYEGLVRISNSPEDARSSLENMLNELNQLRSSEYTVESWNALYDLMQQAQILLDNGSSQEELDDLLAKLRAARNRLVQEEVMTETETQKTEINSSDEKAASRTGDESHIAFWVILGVIALGAIGILAFTNKRK